MGTNPEMFLNDLDNFKLGANGRSYEDIVLDKGKLESLAAHTEHRTSAST